MNIRIVAREIKREIWPMLRGHGFSKFSEKTAWRYLPEQIYVVNFQSFNRYLADGLGCTTFSFALNLGIYFKAIPEIGKVNGKPDPSEAPQASDCHFRHSLLKGITQPSVCRSIWPAELDDPGEALAKVRDVLQTPLAPRPDIWIVDPDGANLSAVVADARTVLEREGLSWFAKHQSMEYVLEVLLAGGHVPQFYSAVDSPVGKHVIGHLAHSLGRHDIAVQMLADADSEFKSIEARFAPFRRRKRK